MQGAIDADWWVSEQLLWEGDDVERLKKLVRAHHVHARDAYGNTLLHWACGAGRSRCTAWLLESGADTEARNDNDWSPLDYAAVYGYPSCVALLLYHGAHVNARDKSAWTSLVFALDNGRVQVARLLLDAGASVKLAREKALIPPWVNDFLRGRNSCAKAVRIFIGISDRQHRDVARLVGQMLWQTRGHEAWAI